MRTKVYIAAALLIGLSMAGTALALNLSDNPAQARGATITAAPTSCCPDSDCCPPGEVCPDCLPVAKGNTKTAAQSSCCSGAENCPPCPFCP